jgi:tetratricopeptide (TPR) repeat protein
MDIKNPVITFCIEGIWAELEDRPDDARLCYQRAWASCVNEYEACMAAHYLARAQDTFEASLQWNLRALELAYLSPQENVRDFYPTLYMSIGHAYKQLGGMVQAQRYYRLAAGIGEIHPLESEDETIRWLKIFDWVQPLLNETIGF